MIFAVTVAAALFTASLVNAQTAVKKTKSSTKATKTEVMQNNQPATAAPHKKKVTTKTVVKKDEVKTQTKK